MKRPMIILKFLLWLLVGSGTALIYFISQQWSVNQIDPQRKAYSLRLILGGTILRWTIVFATMWAAINDSYQALLIVFLTFLAFRFMFLLNWQGWLHIKNPFVRQAKG